jgi:aspartate beta-hydroxylase
VVRDAAGGKSKATGNSKTAKSGGAKSSEAKAGTKKSQKKSKTEENKSSNKNKGGKSTKPKSKKKREVPTIPMSEVRLLRRPVPANDSDRPYIIEILNGDNLLLDERFSEALEKFNEILKMFPQSPRALFGKGETLSGLAKQKSSNKLMETAIDFYKDAANSFLAPKDIKVAALARLADLYQERGRHSAAIAALEKLYTLEGDDPVVANRLGAGYVRTGNTKKAEKHFKKVLDETPDNYYAKAHLGYLLFSEKHYEEALPMLMEGIRKDKAIQRNGRFYLYAGEALVRLNRSDEAHVLYSEGVSRDLFPSLYQRSIFNEPDLRATPWWTIQETGYQKHLQPLLNALDNITSEVIPALLGDSRSPPRLFPLFSQGKKNAENCRKIPRTCSLLEAVPEATSCKHGEVKFIVVPPETHIPSHTGQSNTRLQVLVGLNLGDGELSVRIAEETRSAMSPHCSGWYEKPGHIVLAQMSLQLLESGHYPVPVSFPGLCRVL